MLENVKVAQIKKIKNQSPFTFEFCFWEDPPHQSTGSQPIPKCISLKCIFPKCIYPKCIFEKGGATYISCEFVHFHFPRIFPPGSQGLP